eukprot:3192176-Prymnesium_polylepis.1
MQVGQWGSERQHRDVSETAARHHAKRARARLPMRSDLMCEGTWDMAHTHPWVVGCGIVVVRARVRAAIVYAVHGGVAGRCKR